MSTLGQVVEVVCSKQPFGTCSMLSSPCTTCEVKPGYTSTYSCGEPSMALLATVIESDFEPCASEPDCVLEICEPSGTTRTLRATASEALLPKARTVSVCAPTFSMRTGIFALPTLSGASVRLVVVEPIAVNQLAVSSSRRTVCSVFK